METTKIKVEAVINAELSKVWQAWTDASHIVHWNFASPDWHCPSANVDLCVGGVNFTRMEARDGSFGFDFKCVYELIEAEKRLVSRMEDGRKIEVSFVSQGDGILLTEIFDAENQNPIELQQMGWQSILNNFKSYVETI
jgi:uncharacterized protein YndB with AHSA1/START domain